MTSRREFLHAAAVSALPITAGAAQITAGAGQIADATGAARQAPVHVDLHSILVDERYSEARAVGTRLAGLGVTVHTVADGDVTQVWLRHIGPAWSREPVAIAGLTARPALFCLEQLAWSCGLRVVFHGEHIVHSDGRTEHSLLRGGSAAHLSSGDLQRAGALWPAVLADAMASRRGQTRRARPGPSAAALAPALPTGAQLLTSWIIAAA